MMLLWEIFYTFLKLGTIAYGGGPAMIPVMQAEIVDAKNWVTDDDFRAALGVGNSLPGPIAPKMAFWAGMQKAGWFGGIVSAFAVVLPGVILMSIITHLLWANLDKSDYLQGAAKGASIGVVGLLAYIAYDQAYKVFIRSTSASNWIEGISQHPNWFVLVVFVFALSLWRPTTMVPLSIIGTAIYGAFFLR